MNDEGLEEAAKRNPACSGEAGGGSPSTVGYDARPKSGCLAAETN